MAAWDVQMFRVSTPNDSGASAIFANGRMQCAVTVSIKGYDPKTLERHELSPEELSSIKLIDYELADGPVLNGQWTYDTDENKYAHSISGPFAASGLAADATAPPAKDEPSSEYDTIRYWVSTTKAEDRKIGARIETPSGKIFTTHTGGFDSHVTVSGKAPIVYKKHNTVLEWEKITTGKWRLDKDDHTSWHNYRHYNYFFELRAGVPLFQATIDGFYDGKKASSGDPRYDARLANAFGFWWGSTKTLKIFSIWDMGPKCEKTVGTEFRRVDPPPILMVWHAHMYKEIAINQRPNALCFSQLCFDNEIYLTIPGWYEESCTFQVFDLYGNTGKFSVSFVNEWIKVSENN